MAAGGSPEVTLVSIYWATTSQSGQRERWQRHSEMHRKHNQYKHNLKWWGEAEVPLTQQLPLPAVWQGDRSSVGKEGPSECDGLDISPLNACSQYNDPARESILIIIQHNVQQQTRFWEGNLKVLTFSFSMARAAILAFLKLTKAQNLSCSTRILSISPYLQRKANNLTVKSTTTLVKYEITCPVQRRTNTTLLKCPSSNWIRNG